MIIVSQDKDNIINFDNVKSLWIDSNVLDKTNANFEICADDEILGQYKTEERAKEVLKQSKIKKRQENPSYIYRTNIIEKLEAKDENISNRPTGI